MDESRLLADAVGIAWPDELEADAAAIEPDLIDALRDLDGAVLADAERAQQQVLDVLGRVPSVNERVHAEIAAMLLVAERGEVTLRTRVPRHSEVAIAYATDRLPTEDHDAARRYGPARGGALRFGIVRVELPDDHRMGELPRPHRHWRLRFGRPGRVCGLDLTETAELAAAVAGLRDCAPGPDVLVFIHGYNVGFADAARRTAQLAYDLDFSGVPVLYSWPSAGSVQAYLADGESAAASQRHFRAFLADLTEVASDGRAHMVAHSMGNRILTEALSTISTYRLGHVVFAAPDVDAQVFIDRARDFNGTAERYTLYVSDRDRALAAARSLAKAPRAGAGPDIVVVDGIDTIDASALDTGFMSHSYVLDHRSVITDVYALLRHNHPPAQRPGMLPMMSSRGPYWRFRP
jgi:esterase/lipase superfamily enzyme